MGKVIDIGETLSLFMELQALGANFKDLVAAMHSDAHIQPKIAKVCHEVDIFLRCS
ncbi:unnamed protein product [Lupinus luteus]|uniref:Uncharacterized protein n=1 Tax=Lupinus luteus TaxID=3873 RepID=A0AAV1XBM6_LUPLU